MTNKQRVRIERCDAPARYVADNGFRRCLGCRDKYGRDGFEVLASDELHGQRCDEPHLVGWGMRWHPEHEGPLWHKQAVLPATEGGAS